MPHQQTRLWRVLRCLSDLAPTYRLSKFISNLAIGILGLKWILISDDKFIKYKNSFEFNQLAGVSGYSRKGGNFCLKNQRTDFIIHFRIKKMLHSLSTWVPNSPAIDSRSHNKKNVWKMTAGKFKIPKSLQSYVRTMYFIVFFVIFGLSEDKSIKDDDGIFF